MYSNYCIVFISIPFTVLVNVFVLCNISLQSHDISSPPMYSICLFYYRYLSNGYTQAYRHVRPDVIIFLGDLFDDGSNAYLTDYIDYYFRFQDIFTTEPGVKVTVLSDTQAGLHRLSPPPSAEVV